MMRLTVLAFFFTVIASSQIITRPGGGSGCSGAANIGDVSTATSAGVNPTCTWQPVGGATVTETAIKNSEYIAVAGTNTLTGNTTTTYGALSAGYTVRVLIANDNTGAVTFSPNSITAAAVTKNGTTALAGGELIAGHLYLLEWDGTRWQILATYTNGSSNDILTSNGQGGFGTALATVPLTKLSTQVTDTVVMNATAGTAVPTAVAMPTCGAGSADLYNTTTHSWSCVSVGGGGGSLAIQIDGGAVGSESILNFITTTCITPTGSNPTGKVNIQFDLNTAACPLPVLTNVDCAPSDITTALNAALAVNGATVSLSQNGACKATNIVWTGNNVTLLGNNSTLQVISGTTGAFIYGNNLTGVSLKGQLTIDGNSIAGITYLVEFDNTTNVSLSPGLVIKNAGPAAGGASSFQGGYKLYASTGTVDGVIVDSVAGYCGELNTLSNVQVTNGTLSNCKKNGLVLANTGVGVPVTGISVHDITDAGPSGNRGSYGNGIFCSSASTCSVHGVTISKTDYSGIRSGSATKIDIVGNTLNQTGDVGIYSEFASGGGTISANNISDCLGGGIFLANGPDANQNWSTLVGDNTITNCMGSSTNGTTTPVYGAGILYTSNTNVNGNVIDGAYWGILGETTSATDSPTPGVQVANNTIIDTRVVTIVGTSPSGTISTNDQLYVGPTWGAATKQAIVAGVIDSTHINVRMLLGFFAASDAIKDNTSGHTASTITVSTVTGPTLQNLTLSGLTNFKLWDTVTLGSGSTGSSGLVTCVYNSTASAGCPTANHITVAVRPNTSSLNVLFPASGTITSSSGGSATISAAANTLINMQVPMVTNTDTTATCQQWFHDNVVGSYITGTIRAASGSPPSTTTAAIGSGVCAGPSGGAAAIDTAGTGILISATKTFSLDTSYTNTLYPQLAVTNTYTAGAKQIFPPSATTAGARVVCGSIPSAQVAGDLICDSGGRLNVADGTNMNTPPFVAGSGTTQATAPTSGQLAQWGSGFSQVGVNLAGAVTTSNSNSTTMIALCEAGLGDGLTAMASGTYLQTTCVNDLSSTWTITDIRCYTDNAGSSTLDVTNGAGTSLLTGAITCSNASIRGAAGTQSATTTIAASDGMKFIFVGDGSSKQTNWIVKFTRTN